MGLIPAGATTTPCRVGFGKCWWGWGGIACRSGTRHDGTVVYESWVDRQIRDAIERGEFDNLPGAGQPLSLSDDPDWWIKAKIAREDIAPLLPTVLALRREVEALDATLSQVPTEAEAQALVEDLNQRIRESYLRPLDGPRVVVGLVDMDAALRTWRGRKRS